MESISNKPYLVRRVVLILILGFASMAIVSCRNNRNDLLSSVNTLVGSRVVLPQEMLFINDVDHRREGVFQQPDYTILIYLDQITCSACKVKEMKMWTDMCRMFNDKGVPTVVLFYTANFAEYKEEIKIQGVEPIFAYDIEGQFKLLNEIPENPLLHSFLLKKDTIVLVGNPYTNPRICEMFLAEIER